MKQRTVFIARLTIIALATTMMSISVFAQQDAENKPEEQKAPAPQPAETPGAPAPQPAETPETPAPQPEEKPEAPAPQPAETPEAPAPQPVEKPEAPAPQPEEKPEAPAPQPEAPPKWKTHLEKKHEAFFAWLEENYPHKANELKEVGNNRPGEFGQRISEIIETYEPIQKADKNSPELAKVLREDLKLQEQRDDILRKLRNAKSKEEQDTLLGELNGVVAARFDAIIQKKQIEYDFTRKRLEWVNKRLQQHGEELQKLKDEKDQNVQNRMKELTDGKIKMDWK